MACRLALALLLAANVHEPRRIHTCNFTSGAYNGVPRDATHNYDKVDSNPAGKATFEDIDGFEWLAAAGTDLGYVVIQEDSGNDLGERMFISKLEPATPLTYYFVAMSGGIYNTRMVGGVGIPAGVNPGANGHEFSGIVDFSGLLATDAWGSFVCSAGDGKCKRAAEATVPINDKMIVLGLQAHNYWGGLISYFNADRGGQAYAYKPELP